MGFLPQTPAQYESGEPATTIGPIRSGRIAAVIMVCQPAGQLAMTIGLLSASGWRRATSSINAASAWQTSSIV